MKRYIYSVIDWLDGEVEREGVRVFRGGGDCG